MNLKIFEPEEGTQVCDLHKLHTEKEVYLPPLDSNCLIDKIVVTDEFGKVVAFAAINILPEVILVHDKSRPIEEKREFLLKIFQAVKQMAANRGFPYLFCFADEEKWIRHLNSVGFKKWDNGILFTNLMKGGE